METPIQVQFCDNTGLERHKAFFRAHAGEEATSLAGSPPHVGEQWKVIAEWDAAHQVPGTGDGRKVNPPALVAWSPKGDRLFTSCDAFGLTAWDPDALLGAYRHPRKLGEDVNPTAYGYPARLFTSQRGGSIHVLQETHSYQHSYYYVHTGDAHRICEGTNEQLWGWGQCTSMGDRRLNRSRGIDPWRPGSDGEVAVVRNQRDLKIVDVRKLPDRPTVDRNWPFELLRWIRGGRPSPTKIPVHEAPAERWFSFDSLGARDKTIFGFHWHPSGEYVAVTTGDWDSQEQRRIYIVHVPSALIVASVPMVAEALGWSPNGRFLLCKRTTVVAGKPEVRPAAWDSMQFAETIEPHDELLSQAWAVRALAASEAEIAVSADGKRLLSNSAMTLCSVKRDGLHILPDREVAEVSSWPFTHAAWHPTDPHLFVTVGGKPSKEFPDTYDRDHDRPHGRLLRVWRLANLGSGQ